MSMRFVVAGFGVIGPQRLALDNLNPTASYQMELVSDKSDAYNEKLTVGNVIIYITAVK